MLCGAAIKRGEDNEDEDMEVSPTRANEQTLSLVLRKKRFKSRRTLAREILFIGCRLRAILMTILCDHYLGCKAPAGANYTFWIRKFPHATFTRGTQFVPGGDER
jgi:hypothetical protein